MMEKRGNFVRGKTRCDNCDELAVANSDFGNVCKSHARQLETSLKKEKK